MMPAQSLLFAGNTLRLEDDLKLLGAIGEVVRRFPDLNARIGGLADAEDLLNEIAAGLNQDAIRQGFAQLGLQGVHDDLVGLLGKITQQTQTIPPKYRALLERLSHFPSETDTEAEVDWSLATPTQPAIKTDRYTVDFGATAGVRFDAFARWPDDAASPKLLEMAAHGEVKGLATAALPFPALPGSISAEAKAGATLAYFFNADDNSVYAAAVASRLTALPDPFHLQSVWDAFQDGGLGLEGVTYTFDGSASGKLNVGFADSLALGAGLTNTLAINVGVTASFNSVYRLRLRRTGAGFRAQLHRDRVTEEGFKLDVAFEVDLSSVAAPVLEALNHYADEWATTLATIKPYLSPGTFLRDLAAGQLADHVKTLVHDDSLREAVLADLKGALGVGDLDESHIAGWLTGQITGALDHGSVLVDGKIDAAVDKVMAKLNKALPVLAKNDPSGKLRTLVAEQVTRVNTELANTVKALFETPAAKVKDALKAAGVTISGAVASADALLKPVRDLLKKYDDALHAFVTKAEAAAKKKATARLYAEESTFDQVVVEVLGDFTDVTPESIKVFHALTLGNLTSLVRIVDGQPSPGFVLNQAASSVTRFSEYKSKQGWAISFFGLDLSYEEFIDGKASVAVDGFGNVHVDTEGKLKKALSIPTSDREVSFVASEALVLAAGVRAANAAGANLPEPVLGLGISVVYRETSLEWKDIDAFIASLANAGLVSGTAAASAKATFARWEDAGGKITDIGASLQISGDAVKRLMRLSDRTPDGLPHEVRKEIVTAATAALKTFGKLGEADFEAGAHAAGTEFIHPALATSTEDIVLLNRKELRPLPLDPTFREDKPFPTPSLFNGDTQRQFDIFFRQAFGLLRLVDLIERMGAIHEAIPKTAATPDGWSEKTYREAETEMARDSREWLTVARTVEGLFTEPATPRTIAFLRTMSNLSGRGEDAPGGVTVTMTYQPKTGDAEMASVT